MIIITNKLKEYILYYGVNAPFFKKNLKEVLLKNKFH